MVDIGHSGSREVWISYQNDDNAVINGYVYLIEQAQSYLKFKTANGNIITISYNRLLKMKEKGQ